MAEDAKAGSMSYYSIAAEKQAAAGELFTKLHNVSDEIGRTDTEHDELIRLLLIRAEPMFWSKDTATLVARSSESIDISNLAINKDLTYIPSAFCWFDQPVLEAGKGRGDDSSRPIVAIGWQWVGRLPVTDQDKIGEVKPISQDEQDKLPLVLHIQSFGDDPGPRPMIAIIADAGTGMGGFVGDFTDGHKDLFKFFVAANAFIRQRLLISAPCPLERHARKRLGPHAPSTVRVVHLRASESSHPRREGSEPVDWSCRWFVRGHWRNQPYKIGIRPRYVLPYLKGPEDKPIKAPAASVYAVTR
jgi:hypothetical protein